MSDRNRHGVEDARLDSPRFTGREIASQLRSTLEYASALLAALEVAESARVEAKSSAASDDAEKLRLGEAVSSLERDLALALQEKKNLEEELRLMTDERDGLQRRVIEIEGQSDRLMNLYVTAHSLHATLDPSEVTATLCDVATNLLGAEQFVVLLKRGDGHEWDVLVGKGLEPGADALFRGPKYSGGEPAVDATLRDGVLHLAAGPDARVAASIPLRLGELTIGALVLIKLLDHKSALGDEERDLMDLIVVHAATALTAARAHVDVMRWQRAQESLSRLRSG
ncbi:MAG: hypothetical protein HY698_03870 [Deltaproteobacteria bacterium]|nr:hypothetical protein [Deltaproteobacteria bacterium]